MELRLPHVGFNRHVGVFDGQPITPDGRVVSAEEHRAGLDDWLPTEADQDHVRSLMMPVHDPGKIAGWIAAPGSGIHAKPVDYEYVRG